MARNTRATAEGTNYYTKADGLYLSSTPVDAHITGIRALPHKSLIPTARRVPTRQRDNPTGRCVLVYAWAQSIFHFGCLGLDGPERAQWGHTK